jgi:hypothetical protein
MKLTTKARKAIPGKDFAGPDRSYPINDANHARNALARASGKPVAPQVRAAVHRKYPGIGQAKSFGEPTSHSQFHALGAPKGGKY